jgi:hypothetical protein
MKIILILIFGVVGCGLASATQIISGSFDRVLRESGYPFNIQLADGFALSGISLLDGPPIAPQCFFGDSSFPPCVFAPFTVFGINSVNTSANPNYNGTFTITLLGPSSFTIDPATIPLGGTVSIPFSFTSMGRLVAPFNPSQPSEPNPCLLPTPDTPGVCLETIAGNGNGQFTLINLPTTLPYGIIQMQSESITFGATNAPEPSSIFLLLAAGGLLWRRVNRRTIAASDCALELQDVASDAVR